MRRKCLKSGFKLLEIMRNHLSTFAAGQPVIMRSGVSREKGMTRFVIAKIIIELQVYTPKQIYDMGIKIYE
jgi:hypothetical protein